MTRHCDVNPVCVDSLSPESQQRLMDILETYLAEQEHGLLPDADQLIARHPDLAEPLKAYLSSLDFLHRATLGFRPSGSTPPTPSEFSEKRLGDYAILGEIGRGGMGIVCEARQISLDRRVALKLLPFAAVLDQKQIARFQNEARAAAQLHHPNIVPIFGFGCERGVHYYAMQYVEGQTIAQLIDELRQLQSSGVPDERREAISRLARDLSSGRPAPASEESRTDRPAGTTADTTPERAKPASETTRGPRAYVSTDGSTRSRGFFRSVADLGVQAAEALEHAHQMGVVHRDVKPSNLMLDVRGDLWVTDFGLAMTRSDPNLTMTGDLLGTLRYMSPEQVRGRRHVLDHRTDLYSLGVTLYELLTLQPAFGSSERERLIRQIAEEDPRPPRQLNKAIPKDLETVVLKATAKEPGERYATARELADDLRRFLEGKPTLAKRPTLADRAGKWAKRHRAVVSSAVALTLIALLSLLASTLLIAREHARTKAALGEARTNYERAEDNFHRAELHFRQARAVVDRFAAHHAERLADLPGAEQLRGELLRDALDYYRGFIEHARDDPALQADLALTHFKVGALQEQVGDRNGALDAYQRGRDILQRLGQEQPTARKYRRDLALCWNNIGLVRAQTGGTAAAQHAYGQAIDVQSRLVRADPDSADFRSDLATTYGNLGLLQSQTNQAARAERSYRAALEAQRELAGRYPDEPRYSGNLAISYNNLGFLHSDSDPVEAERCYHDALSTQKRLVAAFPGDVKYQGDLALTYNNLGALQSRNGRLDEAEASYRQAIAIQETLGPKAPLVLQFRRDSAISHNNLGGVYSKSERHGEACESFARARVTLNDLVKDFPHDLSHRSSLGGVLNNQGMALERLGRLEEAVAAYGEAIEHQRFALEHAPEVARFREFLSKHYCNLGRALRAAGRPGEAAEAALARRELWPKGADRLYRVAVELTLAVAQIGSGDVASSAQGASAKQEYVDEAVATLRRAIAAGFTQVDQIRENPELDGIRGHPEFGELVEQLGTSAGSAEKQVPDLGVAAVEPSKPSAIDSSKLFPGRSPKERRPALIAPPQKASMQ
ncbi:MAG TPA: serine/threonine-protein kinase [Thermoguttaceae bacterium]|nr:serine/threonine-protein kinase [Thermoguttaceae bacterium]